MKILTDEDLIGVVVENNDVSFEFEYFSFRVNLATLKRNVDSMYNGYYATRDKPETITRRN